MAKLLLITGFEPFDGQSINPSWEAVRLLPDHIGKYRLEKRLIPVEYGAAARMLQGLADQLRPDVVLSIGQAGGRAEITPEVIGINLREAAIEDNAGVLCQGTPIAPQGPDGLFATVPVREMVRAIRSAQLPARLSYSAGAFVCNDVLYSSLLHFRNTGVTAGFIHVPYLPQQGSPSLTLEQIIQGLTAAIEALP